MSMTEEQANAAMMRNVAVPTFFQKVASHTGHSPSDNAAADQLLRTNDMVKVAVDKYIQACYDAERQQNDSAVKTATDAAFALAGVAPAAQPQFQGVEAEAFLADDSVKAAAAAMVESYVKAANAAAGIVAPPQMTPDEEEEERKKKELGDAPPG